MSEEGKRRLSMSVRKKNKIPFSKKTVEVDSKNFSEAENYKRMTGKYTEEDFLNPKPGMIDDIWYKLAYADWAYPRGLMKSFNSAEELIKYLHNNHKG